MTYTDTDRTQALTLYTEAGTAEASRQTGIPARTIRLWAKKAGLTAATQNDRAASIEALQVENRVRREEFQHLAFEKAMDLLGRMDEPHVDFRGKDAQEVVFPRATSVDVKNYALAVGILLDKVRLEEGKATGRVESSVEMVDQAARMLREFVEAAEEHANSG